MATFERYAVGTVSAAQLADETGLKASRIRCMLMNPIYNGWVTRKRGSPRPATWRADPPVSDALWARVEDVRRGKTRGGGPKRSRHVDLLRGLLQCVCGRRLRSDGTFADGRHRKLHPDPCHEWGTRARLGDETWETPILAQVADMRLDPGTFTEVVAALAPNERPVRLDKARLERQIKVLAGENAEGKLEDDVYLERKRQLRSQIEGLARSGRPGIPAARAVEWLRALSLTWQAADVQEEKADLLDAIYDRIVVAGETIVSARLTPEAQAHGMAVALPEVVMARPTGFAHARTHRRSTWIPIEGATDWPRLSTRPPDPESVA